MSTSLKLINKDGGEIYSNLPKLLDEHYNTCTKENELIERSSATKKMRHGIIKNEFGIAYMISDEKEMVDRPRYFKEKLSVYAEHLKEINSIKEDIRTTIQADNRRLVHNITSINGHNIQEIYLLVPEEKLSMDYKGILEIIKEYLLKDPDSAASAFLRIAKNSIAMKSEFTVFKKLYGGTPILQKQYHDIKKVLLTVFHVFFQDFKELNVHVQIDDNRKSLFIDFETIRVALYHFIDNATKYILPDSKLRINFYEENNIFTISFEMTSMEIKQSEIKDIFNEGVSGENAKKSKKNGDGLGLKIICEILKLNNAEFRIHPNHQQHAPIRSNGVNYVRNIFEMNFRLPQTGPIVPQSIQ